MLIHTLLKCFRRTRLAKLQVVAALLMLSCTHSVRAAEPAAGYTPVELDGKRIPKEKLIVYLFLGHSNMDGRADEWDRQSHPRVWRYDLQSKPRQWQKAQGRDSLKGKGGPTLPFLQAMATAYPDYYFGVINNALSGNTVNRNYRRGKRHYNEIINAAKDVQRYATLGGVVTMLGYVEAAQNEGTDQFGQQFESMVQEMREDLSEPSLPFFITQYEVGAQDKGKRWKTIRDSIDKLPQRIKYATVIPTDGLSYDDDHHFDKNGYLQWAARVEQAVSRDESLSWRTQANRSQMVTASVPNVRARATAKADAANGDVSNRDAGKPRVAKSTLKESGDNRQSTELPGGGDSETRNKKPRLVAEVEAVLRRTSKVPDLKQIHPYKEAVVCAEYEIKKVREGRLNDKRMVTMQLAIEKGEILPPASFKEGERYRLKVGLWEEQKPFHSFPLADDIQDFDATLYYIMAAEPLTRDESSSRDRSSRDRSNRERTFRDRSDRDRSDREDSSRKRSSRKHSRDDDDD